MSIRLHRQGFRTFDELCGDLQALADGGEVEIMKGVAYRSGVRPKGKIAIHRSDGIARLALGGETVLTFSSSDFRGGWLSSSTKHGYHLRADLGERVGTLHIMARDPS